MRTVKLSERTGRKWRRYDDESFCLKHFRSFVTDEKRRGWPGCSDLSPEVIRPPVNRVDLTRVSKPLDGGRLFFPLSIVSL